MQEGADWRDVGGEALIVNQLARCKIEAQQASRAQTVIAVVNRPQPVETVDDDTQYRIKQPTL